MPKQKFEGKLKGCKKDKCEFCCCDEDQVEEWIVEYVAFHERMKDLLTKNGIKLEFYNDRVRFYNCSDGKNCKFLKLSPNKNIDPRPIDCKIYPYVVDWNTIDFDKRVVKIYFWDMTCPLIKTGKINLKFRKQVENILKRDFGYLFHGMEFTIKIINKELSN